MKKFILAILFISMPAFSFDIIVPTKDKESCESLKNGKAAEAWPDRSLTCEFREGRWQLRAVEKNI